MDGWMKLYTATEMHYFREDEKKHPMDCTMFSSLCGSVVKTTGIALIRHPVTRTKCVNCLTLIDPTTGKPKG